MDDSGERTEARPAGVPAMRWAAAASRDSNPWRAAEDTARALRAALDDGPVDLVLAFFSAPFVPAAEEIRAVLARVLDPGCLGGVSGGGVIAADQEIEQGEALAVIGARLPGVTVAPFLLPAAEWGDAPADAEDFALCAAGAAGAEVALVFGDPFSLPIKEVLRSFDRHAAGLRLAGGLAGAGRPGQNAIFLNQWTSREGGFAVALSGAVRADVVVSQGCRPVGPPLAVTGVRRDILLQLDGVPAAERLQQVLAEMPEEDQVLVRHGLFLGRPAVSNASAPGDYLVRNVIGHDPGSGALAVGDAVTEGERVRLHVRDAATAGEDLELMLAPQAFDARAAAALVFSCNGRGQGFFGEPNADIARLQEALGGGVPAAGLFCAGEIGPIGGRNFLHGQTASVVILRTK